MFQAAGQPDIVRSAQKDAYVLSLFQNDCRELSLEMMGQRSVRYEAEIDLLSRSCYYGLTTALGSRTLGEEYVDVLPVTSTLEPLAARRRMSLIFFHTFLPYIYQRVKRNRRTFRLNNSPLPSFSMPPSPVSTTTTTTSSSAAAVASASASSTTSSPEPSSTSPPPSRPSILRRLLHWIKTLYGTLKHYIIRTYNGCLDALTSLNESSLHTLSKAHLALFYLFGRFLHFSHRFTGTQYVYVRKIHMERPTYKVLGVLILIQLGVAGAIYARAHLRALAAARAQAREREDFDGGLHFNSNGSNNMSASLDGERKYTYDGEANNKSGSESESESDSDTEGKDCILCMCTREKTTSTECGHLYCWECITECLTNKPECPLCRSKCELKNLLLISHYD